MASSTLGILETLVSLAILISSFLENGLNIKTSYYKVEKTSNS